MKSEDPYAVFRHFAEGMKAREWPPDRELVFLHGPDETRRLTVGDFLKLLKAKHDQV